jgi:hypothetical protein
MNRQPHPRTVTYAQAAARIEPIAEALERIAYRLRQGAISSELAAEKLAALALDLDPEQGQS